MKQLIPTLVLSTCAVQAHAFSIQAGDWTLGISGNVNSHLVLAGCDNSGHIVDGNALLCTGNDAASVSNGYLPASIQWTLSTQQAGYQLSGNVALEPGLVTNAAFNGQDDDQAIRAFLTVAKEEGGTLKAGRDYGVYALDVILADMSLIGVGAHGLVKNPLNTSFGSVGYGYIFTDRLSQITYATPLGSAAELTLGLFQPLNLITLGSEGFSGDSGSRYPGMHGKLRYNFDGGFVSSSFLGQNVDAGGADYTAKTIDLTASVQLGNAGLVGSCFVADGVGTAGLFIDAAAADGTPRESSGCFAQATYRFEATKVGVSYGQTRLDRAGSDSTLLLNTQDKLTLGLYHNLTDSLTLSGEYSRFTAENHQGDELKNDSFNLGLALFF